MTTRAPRGGVAGTRGGSAGDPRPPASSANAARACLEHLCDCLRALGVGTAAGASHDPTALTAETLRRAKFDQPAAAAPLWRALHDLFLVSHAGFPEPSVAAETLRVLRDETARRDDFDENEETSVGSETSETSRRRDTDVETHRCVALRGLRLAKYPRLDTLETNNESNDTFDRESDRELASPSSSRAILVALAWAAADLDVFALAHADRSARDLGASGLGVPNVGDDTELTTDKRNESFLLPPYGSDAAASPASAEAHAASAEAAERAYLDAAAGTIARFENNGRASGGKIVGRSSLTTSHTTVKASLEKQTALLSQRVWQSVSHVRALERSRATRRVAVVDAQRAFSRAKNENPKNEAPFLTATEIGLARDAGARRRAAAAMRAVLTTKDRAKETVALAETFWAWMRSVLELDEKEKKARRISDSRNASRNVGADDETRDETKLLDKSSSHRTQRRSDDPSSDRVFLPNTNSVVAALETAARRLGPALRRRRRDVETVARTWRATREASRLDPERYAELSALAMAAAARTPSLASFEAGARAKLTAETVETVETVDRVETRESLNEKDPSDGFSFDFASARSPDDAPAPPGVAEALALRRGDTGSNPAGNAAGGEDGTSRMVVRFGSSLLPASGAKSSARRGETCAEAAARLRDSLHDAEALLEAQRSRAVDALRREITHAFLENGDATLAPAAVHGWDR